MSVKWLGAIFPLYGVYLDCSGAEKRPEPASISLASLRKLSWRRTSFLFLYSGLFRFLYLGFEQASENTHMTWAKGAGKGQGVS
jgi:hypothetical protein